MQRQIDHARRHGATKADLKALAEGLWEQLQGGRKAAEAPPDPQAVSLGKSLFPGRSPAEATKAARLVLVYGRQHGLQPVPYNVDLAAKLLVTKAITMPEHHVWQQEGWLPRGIDLAAPQPREAPAPSRLAYALNGIAALALPRALVTGR